MRNDDELKQLAIDHSAGRIFTDQQCRTPEEVKMVFMPFAFMTAETMVDIEKQIGGVPAMAYEYFDKALPRGVNGLPMFSSVQFLTQEELLRVIEIKKQLRDWKPEGEADATTHV